MASRRHLRSFIMSLGVFPTVAAPGRCAVGLFPLVVFQSPTGTHVRHRIPIHVAYAFHLDSNRPSMRFCWSPPALSIRGIDFEESHVWGRLRDTRTLHWDHPSPEGVAVHDPFRILDRTLPDTRRIGCRDDRSVQRTGSSSNGSPEGPLRQIATRVSLDWTPLRSSNQTEAEAPSSLDAGSSCRLPEGFWRLPPSDALALPHSEEVVRLVTPDRCS